MIELGSAILSVLLIAVSQLLFKGAAKRDLGARATLLQVPVLAGLMINVIAAGCWVFALRRHELNYLFPLLSLNYLIVPVAARWVFGERLNRRRLIAIAMIGCGVGLCFAAGLPSAKH